MKFEIVKISELSGAAASIYSVIFGEDEHTLFDKFIKENLAEFKDEVEDILERLQIIGFRYGGREQFFKIGEGGPGDLVCALYDQPESKLRLYCIRYGSGLIVLGGGGPKPKTIRALQEDPKLWSENKIIKHIADAIFLRTREKEIKFTPDGKDLIGNLKFNDEDE